MKGEVSMDREAGPRLAGGSCGRRRELGGNMGWGTGRGCGGGRLKPRLTGGLRGERGVRALSHDLLSLTGSEAGASSLHMGDRLGGDSFREGLQYCQMGVIL